VCEGEGVSECQGVCVCVCVCVADRKGGYVSFSACVCVSPPPLTPIDVSEWQTEKEGVCVSVCVRGQYPYQCLYGSFECVKETHTHIHTLPHTRASLLCRCIHVRHFYVGLFCKRTSCVYSHVCLFMYVIFAVRMSLLCRSLLQTYELCILTKEQPKH